LVSTRREATGAGPQVLEDVLRPGDAESTEVYLCGGQRMIEDCRTRLKEKGFPEESLHHENFF
jgi:ferredoxin-NADP reductase